MNKNRNERRVLTVQKDILDFVCHGKKHHKQQESKLQDLRGIDRY